MDFNFGSAAPAADKKDDHSPIDAFGSGEPFTTGRVSADDFEHITDEHKLDSDFVVPAPTTTTASADVHKTHDKEPVHFDDVYTDVKHDVEDLFGSHGHKAKSTVDFMAAERSFMSAPPPPVPEPKKVASIYDEIEDDYLNPYASTAALPAAAQKNTEQFISSEDLLGDFKESEGSRSETPELIKESFEKKEEPSSWAAQKPVEPEEEKPIVKPIVEERVEEPTKIEAVPIVAVPIVAAPAPVVKQPEITKPEPKVVEVVEQPKPVVKAPEVKAPAVVPAPVAPAKKPTEQMIAAEEIFCKIGLDTWFKPDRLHPKVESLIYWRDTKKSGVVFGAGLAILLAISFFSVISVFAYVALLGLFGTISFRIYKNVLQAVQKTSEGHPFKEYLDFELALPQEKVQEVATVGVAHINAFLAELRRLFLVEDLIDSIKFGLLLWCLTYLGSWFNGMTLVILAFVALFTLPKVYETNKQSIDTYLDIVRSKILEITDKVKAAVPIGKKPAESDKQK